MTRNPSVIGSDYENKNGENKDSKNEGKTIEEVFCESTTEAREDLDLLPVTRRGRLKACHRVPEIRPAVEYNLLEEGKDDKMILEWEQGSDMNNIISEARHMIQTGELSEIESVVKVMKRQENQHSASVIASIATLLGQNISARHIEVKQSVSTGLADIMLWDVRLITSKDTWPTRRHYSFLHLFSDPTERVEAKGIVHGYLGRMASREMEQF